MQLINHLFEKPNPVHSLYEDTQTKYLIRKEIGKRLLDHSEILSCPQEQIICTVSLATFANEEETVQVAHILSWGIKQTDVIPYVTQYKGKDLAYRCLISLSFYYPYMEERTKRKAAPKPTFYREIGIQEFNNIGMPTVSNHFQQWETFLQEFFS